MRTPVVPSQERLFEHATAHFTLYNDYLSALNDSSRIHEVLEAPHCVTVSEERVIHGANIILKDHLHQVAHDVNLLGGWDFLPLVVAGGYSGAAKIGSLLLNEEGNHPNPINSVVKLKRFASCTSKHSLPVLMDGITLDPIYEQYL